MKKVLILALLVGAGCRDSLSRRLDSTVVDLDVQGVPLSDALRGLSERTGIDIRLVGDANPLVSMKLSQARLRSALALLLKPRDFDFVIRDSDILVGPRNCAALMD